MKKNINLGDLLFNVFCWGTDYGQLLMEEERESEDLTDAMVCGYTGRKYGVPSNPIRRRKIHSKKWLNAKIESKKKAIKTIGEFYNIFIKK